MRPISEKNKKIVWIYMVLALSLILVLFMGRDAIYAKEKSEADETDSPRYFREEDGIWRRQEDGFDRLLSKATRTIRYSGYIISMNDSSMEFSQVTRDIMRLTDNAHIKMEQELGCSAVCMFVGDLMCLKGQQYAAEVKGGYDFWPSYSYVAEQFKTADFVCGNLETLLSDSNPTTKNQVNAANGQPQCNGPKVYLDALRRAGFDMVVTANNHTCDWGSTGITETKTHLDEAGFANVGTHYNKKNPEKAGERFSIFEVNGIKVAVLSYTHIINQRGYLSSSEMSTMVHCFDRDVVKQDIADAREKGAEFVVVYCHWGIENTETLNSAQTEDSKFVAEAGADLIIGSHPHCLQKCTYIKTEDGRKVLCMFSMGNFVSSMARDINNDTIILRVEIKKVVKKKKYTVKMADVSYIPCHVMTKDGHSFVAVPTNKKLNGGYSADTLNAAQKRIDKIMNGVIKEYTGT